MKAKLTLSIDMEVIQKAKALTSKRKQSLSFIVEDYLKSLFIKPIASTSKKKLTYTEEFRKKFPPPNTSRTDKEMEKSKLEYLLKKHG
jgi:hypothetical protein